MQIEADNDPEPIKQSIIYSYVSPQMSQKASSSTGKGDQERKRGRVVNAEKFAKGSKTEKNLVKLSEMAKL